MTKTLRCAAATVSLASAFAIADVAAAQPQIETVQEPELRRAINNAHHEMAVCAAFYMVSVEGMETNPTGKEAAESAKIAAVRLYNHMLVLHHKDVTDARVKMEVASMFKEIRNDYSNYSIILEKYAENCATITNDPLGFVEGWFEKELNRQ